MQPIFKDQFCNYLIIGVSLLPTKVSLDAAINTDYVFESLDDILALNGVLR